MLSPFCCGTNVPTMKKSLCSSDCWSSQTSTQDYPTNVARSASMTVRSVELCCYYYCTVGTTRGFDVLAYAVRHSLLVKHVLSY